MGKWTFGFPDDQIANKKYTGLQPANSSVMVELSRTGQNGNGWALVPSDQLGRAVVDSCRTLPDGNTRPCEGRHSSCWQNRHRVDLRGNAGVRRQQRRRGALCVGQACRNGNRLLELNPKLTVILEYGVPPKGCHLRSRAGRSSGMALGSLALGSPAYLAALEASPISFHWQVRRPQSPIEAR